MSLPILLLLLGCTYIVIFGGLSLMRREGLSLRFAIEAVGLTLIASALSALTAISIQPVIFFILLYVITMRVRLLSDVGTLFAKRANFAAADRLYDLALHLWPDAAGKLIVKINQATALLQRNQLDQAIALLNEVLAAAKEGYLSIKYESATYYNLGVAYQRQGLEAQAVKAFNAVLDTWPSSIYARNASQALQHRRQKK
ncbi:MAG: tetratricopeptide repeat protein [Chloroflexi bacterium]|nr:tetratricopeptide repeat protein [Chloroflexota bacterium]